MTNHRPQSELYREAASIWVDLDAAARMLEEAKTAVFSQRVNNVLADNPTFSVAKAELKVRGSIAWREYVGSLVEARTKANRAKVEVDAIKMRAMEQNSKDAYDRQEMRMTR